MIKKMIRKQVIDIKNIGKKEEKAKDKKNESIDKKGYI